MTDFKRNDTSSACEKSQQPTQTHEVIVEQQVICTCGRPFYRSETVTDECPSCYELRLEHGL
jgi:hypothetical protein